MSKVFSIGEITEAKIYGIIIVNIARYIVAPINYRIKVSV